MLHVEKTTGSQQRWPTFGSFCYLLIDIQVLDISLSSYPLSNLNLNGSVSQGKASGIKIRSEDRIDNSKRR